MNYDEMKKKIEQQIKNHKIVLYMKGTKEMPQCGFSAAVVKCLDDVGANYETVDVLSDEETRSGIKTFSNWPTIPQLYVAGKFVGGCDIVRELHAKGELKKLVEEAIEK